MTTLRTFHGRTDRERPKAHTVEVATSAGYSPAGSTVGLTFNMEGPVAEGRFRRPSVLVDMDLEEARKLRAELDARIRWVEETQAWETGQPVEDLLDIPPGTRVVVSVPTHPFQPHHRRVVGVVLYTAADREVIVQPEDPKYEGETLQLLFPWDKARMRKGPHV